MYKLQDVFLQPYTGDASVHDLYYKGTISMDADKVPFIRSKGKVDAFTYFGSLSVEKWRRYTYANTFYLNLEAGGDFVIDIIGGAMRETRGKAATKKLLSRQYFLGRRTAISIMLPVDETISVVGFVIRAGSDVRIFNAYYSAGLEDEVKYRNPYIAIVTTTFRKEAYVAHNMRQLKEELFSDPDYKEHFCWNIIDNGRSLAPIEEERIRSFANPNVGGAGGFARGMLVSLRQKKKPTHIVLMDDDVKISMTSLKRLYRLLHILKDEYLAHFVSGAMMKMEKPTIQQEDIGIFDQAGYCRGAKPNDLDMVKKTNIIQNEAYRFADDGHYYAGWWFCCMPTTVVRTDNLPLPVFVRGDDVEYSLRNHAKFITMNGICIWHEGFEGKFSTTMECYQVLRNQLLVASLHEELSDVRAWQNIEDFFWHEIYKFNYRGAKFIMDAVLDYMKGPDYVYAIDGEACMQKKRKADNKMKPLHDAVREQMDIRDKLFNYRQLEGMLKKALYYYTFNGQARIPDFVSGKRIGVIPYGFPYVPYKMVLTSVNYAVDYQNETYTVFRKNRKIFKKLRRGFEQLRAEYFANKDRIAGEYRNSFAKVTAEGFWDAYLNTKEIKSEEGNV